jgi:murein DD-endopeptidase MepM/ murein hydrolase activator NlpD
LKSEAGNATRLVVFDACRNELKYAMSSSKSLAGAKGFIPEKEEGGILIAYATAEGELASDAGDGAGPYARALAEEILVPGVEAVTMFRRVQLRVKKAIGQEPWLAYGALEEIFLAGDSFEPPPKVVGSIEKTTQAASTELPRSAAAIAWDEIKTSNNPLLLEEFILKHGSTPYGVLARKRLVEIKNREEVAKLLNSPPTKVVAAEQTSVPEVPSIQTGSIAHREAGSKPAFGWPARGRVIADYGKRDDGTKNDGINIALPQGADIQAAGDGRVAYTGSEIKGYGNLILIRHDNGWVSAYAHNEKILVQRDDVVKRGQVIAKAGKSGDVTETQLHFELRQGAKPTNPLQYLEK